MKPDKGNGVVILNKDDYNKKMDAILSDTSKFQLLNEDPVKVTLQRENQVKSLLKKLKAANSLNEKTYSKLYPTGSRIGILYGLPKIHNPPFLLDQFFPRSTTIHTSLPNSLFHF